MTCLGIVPMFSQMKNRRPGEVILTRCTNPSTTESRNVSAVRESKEIELYKGPIGEAERIGEAYEWTLPQVSAQEIIRPLAEANLSLGDRMNDVQELVDGLVLRGKPRGHCSLCPV